MANTYTQLHVHFVFVVKYRAAVIHPAWEVLLQRYICGIVQGNGHKVLAINSVPDHLHLFIGLNPKQSVSELMRLVKCDSSEFVNKQKLTEHKFQWQDGYGAFTHSHSAIDTVVKYVLNQKEHHRVKTFREEYIKLLNDAGIDYDDRYLFHDPLDA